MDLTTDCNCLNCCLKARWEQYYFYEQIDPRKSGDIRYFRVLCRDLREQIAVFNCWRKEQRKIRLIK